MLHIIKQLCGDKLVASDGEFGHVSDVYFDDRSWAVRYVVADTGSWIEGRQVLLSPHAFGGVVGKGKAIVNLSRSQIEKSPSIEEHKPVSRQYEEEYFRYYGWPSYWQGNSVWGMSAFPGALWETSAIPLGVIPEPINEEPKSNPEDAGLRSARAVVSYAIEASDGILGHVTDFLMDETSWVIRDLVVETGHWFSGKKISISTSDVHGVSHDEFKVKVKLTQEAIRQAPAGAEI